jgi:hypothetical protein
MQPVQTTSRFYVNQGRLQIVLAEKPVERAPCFQNPRVASIDAPGCKARGNRR